MIYIVSGPSSRWWRCIKNKISQIKNNNNNNNNNNNLTSESGFGSSPKPNQSVLVHTLSTTCSPSFIQIHPQLFEISSFTYIVLAPSLNGEKSIKKLSDLHQKWIDSSSSYTQHVHQISCESIQNFLRYPAHKQPKQTKNKDRQEWKHNHLPPLVVEVMIIA